MTDCLVATYAPHTLRQRLDAAGIPAREMEMRHPNPAFGFFWVPSDREDEAKRIRHEAERAEWELATVAS